MRPLDEQVILVTGATDGLGRGVAERLAGAGATVLVHGRDDGRGAATIRDIRDATGSERLRWYRADLASLADVRALADRVTAGEPRLDALVNNAGIGTTLPGDGARQVSADGYELRFQVNYLAHYLLTRLLLPLLERSAPARIINVSSAGQAPIDFDDVMLERRYEGYLAYCRSKLAQIMFTIDLADELVGRGVTVNALHPGTFMPTKIVTHAGVDPLTPLAQGIDATVGLVTDPALDGTTGRYFDGWRESQPNAQAGDAAARRRLRELSDRLAGLVVRRG
ncbi:MAG TPA: SDR family NAD(P)-dependent oxidoreductase [Acidimicrobiales bacterium]|nr:SDR family NAD(P)-dependent oxidoreductase [Acidimicrobiales bacterium]